MTHAHNLPGIGAHEFLLAVMHDPTVDLHDRMIAAEELCRLGLGDIGTIRTLRVVLNNPIGYQPTEEEREEVQLVERIWASGQTLTSLGYFDTPGPLSPTILGGLPTKGRVN
jgi:hypothetical protein